MRNWAKNVSRAALVAAGLTAVGAGLPTGPALADTTTGKFSVLGGNQLYAPVSIPVNLSGNALSLLGVAKAKAHGGAHVANVEHGPGMSTSGKFSLIGGNQIYAPISAPLNICGNSIAAGAVTKAYCHGYATVHNIITGHRASYSDPDPSGAMTTSGKFSILGGNQAYIPISVPINICGNAASLLGYAKGKCHGSATVHNVLVGGHRYHTPPAPPTGDTPPWGQYPPTGDNPPTGQLPPTKRVVRSAKRVVTSAKRVVTSAKRITDPTPKDAMEMPPVAQGLRNLIRGVGVPVPAYPGEPVGDAKPGLPVKGLPINVLGHKLPIGQ
ncbi:chaplin family protein [Actinomadura rupiterrae]|uniref:chaplin family protein n=1 Tax=Actinomadura rupiterrae TaxID=559627 RepID=UPI0020A5382B|nr:chaplin family protein [Actinomadura rupiterrae]MCP2335158.1 hypothetical protein [Actinomadura rupiterrae]